MLRRSTDSLAVWSVLTAFLSAIWSSLSDQSFTSRVHNMDTDIVCVSESPEFQLFCENMINPDIAMAKNILSRCHWQNRQPYCGNLKEAPSVNAYMRGLFSVDSSGCTTKHDLIQETCTVDSNMGQWRFDRVGPLSSSGGFTWHQFLSPALQTFGDWNFSFATGFFGGSLTTENELLGYPPIHQHHHHLGEGQVEFYSSPFIIHGDDQCLSVYGGPYCYMRILPSGFGSRLEGPPFFRWHEVNDVREAGSSLLIHYVFTGLRLLCSTCEVSRTVSQFNLGVGGIPSPNDGVYHGTQLVPAQCESVSWNEAKLPDSGLLVWAYLHTHQPGVNDFWLLRRSPDSLGLLNTFLVFAKNQALPLLEINTTSIQSSLKGKLRERASLVCSFEHLKMPIQEGYGRPPQQYYRLSPICETFKAQKDEVVTLIAFFSARDVNDSDGFVQQHTSLRLWFTFDNEHFASREDLCGKC